MTRQPCGSVINPSGWSCFAHPSQTFIRHPIAINHYYPSISVTFKSTSRSPEDTLRTISSGWGTGLRWRWGQRGQQHSGALSPSHPSLAKKLSSYHRARRIRSKPSLRRWSSSRTGSRDGDEPYRYTASCGSHHPPDRRRWAQPFLSHLHPTDKLSPESSILSHHIGHFPSNVLHPTPSNLTSTARILECDLGVTIREAISNAGQTGAEEQMDQVADAAKAMA